MFVWLKQAARLGLLCLFSSSLLAEKTLTLGVLSVRPAEITQARWQPLAAYLSEQLPGYRVELLVADYPSLEQLIAQGKVDLLLTNPSHSIRLREHHALTGVLATLQYASGGHVLSHFGGVFIVDAQREQLNSLEAVSGLRFAAVEPGSLGGYQAQLLALSSRGLPLPTDIDFTGMPHDRVVDRVLRGEADVGLIRTGVLESLIAEDKIAADALRVLAPRQFAEFPFLVSTDLYPEWPLIALPHLDPALGQRVTALLLLMGLDHPEVAAELGIAGFTLPADYQPVETLMRTLRLPPFDLSPLNQLQALWMANPFLYSLVLASVILALGLAWTLVLLYQRAEHRARQLAEQMHKLATQVPGVIYQFQLTQDGRMFFPYASKGIQQVYGVNPEEVMTQADRVFETIHPDDRSLVEESIYLSAHHLTQWHQEYRVLAEEGKTRWVEGRAEPERMANGDVLWHGYIGEITPRKQAELALEEQREALIYSNAELEQFAYVISHDLRQPLRLISSYIELLKRSLAERLDPQAQTMMGYTVQAAQRMDQMLVGLLHYSRVGRKGQPMQACQSWAVFEEALRYVQPELLHSEGQVDFPEASLWPEVWGSPDELMRVFQNLLSNAIKYHQPGHPPQVRIDFEPQTDAWQFVVADQGMGFEPSQAHRLFKVFQRLHSREEIEGSGIGLAICAKIIRRHSGRLWGESAGNQQGARFFFTLPKTSVALTQRGSGDQD